MTATALGVWLTLALPAAPRPKDPPPKPLPVLPEPADEALDREAWLFAEVVSQLAGQVAAEYVTPVDPKDLLVAGATEVWAAAGLELPNHLRDRIRKADGPDQQMKALHLARTVLGKAPAVEGVKATVVAVNGFAKKTDPYCGLFAQRTGASFASSDAEFGLGFELDGATGPAWLAYQLDLFHVVGRRGLPATCPVNFPWVVKRVIPGSPAAAAGIRPGDTITHMNGGDPITAKTSPAEFRRLVAVTQPDARDPGTVVDAAKPVRFRLTRPGTETPLDVAVVREAYTPESVFGVIRRKDGTWDHMLDPANKIGYIRIGAVENGNGFVSVPGTVEGFQTAMAGLVKAGAAGVVLDLRWCPGGLLQPTVRIAGLLLPEGKAIVRMKYRHPERQPQQDFNAEPAAGREAFIAMPLVVLVGPDTTGGGEMIAAALQDHERAIVVGQRTFGKANIMTAIATRFPGLMFKVSTGYSLRPNGKNRHRSPDSKPTDDWGVRPDRGYEIPVTADLMAQLRASADRQAMRPAADREAVEYDDPLADPQRLVAVKFLRERASKAPRD